MLSLIIIHFPYPFRFDSISISSRYFNFYKRVQWSIIVDPTGWIYPVVNVAIFGHMLCTYSMNTNLRQFFSCLVFSFLSFILFLLLVILLYFFQFNGWFHFPSFCEIWFRLLKCMQPKRANQYWNKGVRSSVSFFLCWPVFWFALAYVWLLFYYYLYVSQILLCDCNVT